MNIYIKAEGKNGVVITGAVLIYKDDKLFGTLKVDEDAPGYLTLTSPNGTKHDVTYHKTP